MRGPSGLTKFRFSSVHLRRNRRRKRNLMHAGCLLARSLCEFSGEFSCYLLRASLHFLIVLPFSSSTQMTGASSSAGRLLTAVLLLLHAPYPAVATHGGTSFDGLDIRFTCGCVCAHESHLQLPPAHMRRVCVHPCSVCLQTGRLASQDTGCSSTRYARCGSNSGLGARLPRHLISLTHNEAHAARALTCGQYIDYNAIYGSGGTLCCAFMLIVHMLSVARRRATVRLLLEISDRLCKCAAPASGCVWLRGSPTRVADRVEPCVNMLAILNADASICPQGDRNAYLNTGVRAPELRPHFLPSTLVRTHVATQRLMPLAAALTWALPVPYPCPSRPPPRTRTGQRRF